ncbi:MULTISPECIES: UbiX family flavin prenyltransferase [unclassified Bacillus (in: firmicutes)]|uniref:UbiX family flavin prenyltransferase n=1 Tax=unclassified Bacillus (in: firmicutes) TaxID=185979 RepID=UPI0004E198C4|nr:MULTISPECIES: flavin prenyltransferase UbiX [unclassified Bacillus (in: firmicutes)]
MKTFIVGLTGASGSIYGLRLIEELAKRDYLVHVIATDTAKQVITFETDIYLETFLKNLQQEGYKTVLEDATNFFASVASGSYHTDGMIIAPCSMGTLAEIAHGISDNLLDRAADVCLKERRPLILLARETPVNLINLENMLTLTKAGATIFPASPGFYSKPTTLNDIIDFMVGKILDSLQIENNLFKKWS